MTFKKSWHGSCSNENCPSEMTDTLFENRLSEMLPEHTNAGSARKIKGTTWRRTMGRTLHLRHRGKRQSCMTSRFRLTVNPDCQAVPEP